MAKKAAKVDDIGADLILKEISWSNPKNLCKTNFEKEMKRDLKDFKDDKEELAALKVRKATYDALMKSLDQGLSKQLKSIENEKKLEKLLPKLRDALKTVEAYREKVKAVAGQIGNAQNTSTVLSGALTRIAASMKKQIELIKDAGY